MSCPDALSRGVPSNRPSTSRYAALLILVSGLAVGKVSRAQVAVTTYHNDNARSGQNLSETSLSPSSVNSTGFGKLFSMPVDGYIYGQPLYVPNVNITGKGIHNAVYVVTEHDSVFAFDADSNAGANSQPLWQVSFINPAKGITTVSLTTLLNCNDIVPEVGITSTPVIDPTTSTLYTVAKTSENGTIVQRLHALDITSGIEKFGGPVVIQAQVLGTGAGSSQGVLPFNSLMENQRSGLLLQNGLVYIAWGSHCDMPPHHGWIMAYDAATLAQVAAWTPSPNGAGAGVWQAGAPPAADSSYVYFSTGNGTFTLNAGGFDAGDTAVKLAAPVGGTFTIADYFTPDNQSSLSRANRDLASGGEMLLPDQPLSAPHQHLLVAGGKQGTVYLVDRDNMGKYSSTANQNVETLNNITSPLYSTASWWNNNVYVGAGGKPLQVFGFNPATGLLTTSPTSVSKHVFEGASGTVAISANGTTNPIVWALDNAGYSGTGGSNPAVLFAYNATNLASLLYASNQNMARDKLGPAVKFSVPTISNGKVYVATQTELDVMGFVPTMKLAMGGAQTGSAGSLLPVPIQVSTAEPPLGSPIAGATVTFSDGGRHGTFSSPTAVTDQSGNASTTYTLSKTPQTVTITATSQGFSAVTTSETSLPGPASSVVVGGGNAQSGPPSTPLPIPLAVKVRDQYTNGVPGVLVTFSDGDGGGSFSPSQVSSDSTGYARTIYTTPPNAGTVKIKASAANVTNPATFTVTVQ
jgi:hypothetical protein